MPTSKMTRIALLSAALIAEVFFILPYLTHHHAATLATFTVVVTIITFHYFTDTLFPHTHDHD